MNALSLVDAAARGRVLVVGTPPPRGRDLDVLAPAESAAAIAEALGANGFEARRTTWARFGPLELVDVRPLADEAMLDRATPIEGCVHACRPDPADDLLLAARAYAADGRLGAGRRARGAVPPEVWDAARARGGARELAAFADALRDGPPAAPVRRVAGRVRRVREAGVVTLSGIDGSGKSTQAELLRSTLETLGFDAAVEWNRLSHDRWLDAIAKPVKRLLRRGATRPAVTAGAEPGGDTSAPPGAWVVVVALANALAHQRSVRAHTLHGRVVVCDRYVLDSVVHLRTRYPASRARRVAIGVVMKLSPPPLASFLLDVPADVAWQRKPRPGRRQRLERETAAYRAECERLGVVRLDATLPASKLAAEIAREVWRRI